MNKPPWNNVSPVNTALPVLSSINQHMLSWVWHGVYNPLITMSPILKLSPFFGVFVTASQSLPPIIGFPLNSELESCYDTLSEPSMRGRGNNRCELSSYHFLISSSMVPMTGRGQNEDYLSK